MTIFSIYTRFCLNFQCFSNKLAAYTKPFSISFLYIFYAFSVHFPYKNFPIKQKEEATFPDFLFLLIPLYFNRISYLSIGFPLFQPDFLSSNWISFIRSVPSRTPRRLSSRMHNPAGLSHRSSDRASMRKYPHICQV